MAAAQFYLSGGGEEGGGGEDEEKEGKCVFSLPPSVPLQSRVCVCV